MSTGPTDNTDGPWQPPQPRSDAHSRPSSRFGDNPGTLLLRGLLGVFLVVIMPPAMSVIFGGLASAFGLSEDVQVWSAFLLTTGLTILIIVLVVRRMVRSPDAGWPAVRDMAVGCVLIVATGAFLLIGACVAILSGMS